MANTQRRRIQVLGTIHIAESCRTSVQRRRECCLDGAVRGSASGAAKRGAGRIAPEAPSSMRGKALHYHRDESPTDPARRAGLAGNSPIQSREARHVPRSTSRQPQGPQHWPLLGQGLCIASLLYFIATVRARLPESHPIGAFQRTCISVFLLLLCGTVFNHYGPVHSQCSIYTRSFKAFVPWFSCTYLF